MDEQRFLNACRLRDEGRLIEACSEFVQIAESTGDPLDKAGVLLHVAHTLVTSGEYEGATAKLSAVRALMEDYPLPTPDGDERFVALELFLDFEEANLFWLRGEDPKGALKRFEAALRKYTPPLKEPRSRDFCEGLQIRCAFVLADIGRWKEALPILEGITSPQEYEEGVAFYLGHCYVEADDYHRAEEKLTEALKLGLPSHLEYRAHCELGRTYYYLENYSIAKEEFEKGAQKADPSYLKQSQIWKWLEITCRALGLPAEAEQYARMAKPS
jgi:tetratricopeptide (TPR) repeat protein